MKKGMEEEGENVEKEEEAAKDPGVVQKIGR